jgi:hypothetical protein
MSAKATIKPATSKTTKNAINHGLDRLRSILELYPMTTVLRNSTHYVVADTMTYLDSSMIDRHGRARPRSRLGGYC